MDEIYERDVVCGIYLFTTEGYKISEVNGKKHFFCGKTCRDEFEKNKTRYLNMEKSEIADQSNRDWEQTSRDPVCGQMINIKDAKGSCLFMNNKYHFCSESCNDVFNNMPSAYADIGEGYIDPNNPNELSRSDFIIF
jgi:Cu+-exporting ATPase